MKRLIFSIFFLTFTVIGCYADSSYFIIPTGDKPSQLGYKYEDGNTYGPISVNVYNNEVFILDEVNLRINIYTCDGEYKNSIKLPNIEGFYQDFGINSQGDIILLTNEGISLLKSGQLIKKYSLPNSVSVPYYISVSNQDNIIFNGLRKPGGQIGIVSGIFNSDGNFQELYGYIILSSYNGLIGLKESNNVFKILSHGNISDILNLPSDNVLPFGLDDNKEIYCTEPTKKGYIFYKINKAGKRISEEREIAFSSAFLGDESIILRSFKLTTKGDIICLDMNKERCRVLIFSL